MSASTNRPGYEAICAAVVRRIARGELAPGARLPTVRAAAAAWGVNVNTAARAYATLAARGLVAGRAGGGTYVLAAALGGASAGQLDALVGAPVAAALALGHAPAAVEACVAARLVGWDAAHAAPRAPLPRVRLNGSHDLSLELLRARLKRGAACEIEWSSSLDGLFALAHDRCDLAGCHLLDGESGEYNAPFVRRVLPGEPVDLVTVAEREQGLMVAAGNPLGLRGVGDLTRSGVRVAVRPRGSGTRVLFDRLLREAGVSATAILQNVEAPATHLALADLVACGAADAGLGIRAAARARGLDFVPLARERYELAVRPATAERPAVQAVLAALRGRSFRTAVARLGGYDAREAGRVRHVE